MGDKDKKISKLTNNLMSGLKPAGEVKTPNKIAPTSTLQRTLAGIQPAGPQLATGNSMDLLDTLISKPLTPQEVERNKRSAAAVDAIGQLGGLISAYANLAGTTKGAVSHDVPVYQGPDTQGWEDRARQKQLEYLSLVNGLERENWERAFRGDELQFRKEQAAQQQANADREHQFRVEAAKESARQFDANQDRMERQHKEELESLDNYRKGQVQASQTRADNSGRGATPNVDTFTSGGYEYSFDRRTGNTATISSMFNAIPKDYVSGLPFEERPADYADGLSQANAKRMRVIQKYAEAYPEYAEMLQEKYPSVITRKKVTGGKKDIDYSSDNGGWSSVVTD